MHDDWLGLDYKRSRTWAPISSKTFLGYVALSDPEGILFEETSSREGLIETNAFHEVRDIMTKVLEAAVLRIESARGGKGRQGKKRNAVRGTEAATETEAAAAEIEKLVNSPSVARALGPDEREHFRLSIERIKNCLLYTSRCV